MKKIELLAPAGNFECLIAAVQSGADAVYLSGKAFGARSFADNFDEDELEKAVDYCHLRNVRVYVTVNTLTSDAEVEQLCGYLEFLNRIGTDAIIVQDIGVLKIAQSIVPELSVHASTQMTVHNGAGVRALEKLGVKRIVLARELSLADINKISNETSAELEIFGHGALCMCYSGQCLMSSIIGGRSGNRGKCAQPCRLKYKVCNNPKEAFYMSLKDLSSLCYINDLKDIGVTSLKIEGRMKGPSYVATVVSIYRKYIDNPQSVKLEDIQLLDDVFNRGGLTDGYLLGKPGQDMFAFNRPENPYRKGSDKIAEELLNETKKENRTLILQAEVNLTKGQPPSIRVKYNDTEVEYIGSAVVEEAKKLPLTLADVRERINKTGGTPFEFSDIEVRLDGGVFLAAGELNNLRRSVLELFEKAYLKTFKRNSRVSGITDIAEYEHKPECGYVCEVTNAEQFEAVKSQPYILFYVPLHLLLKKGLDFDNFKKKIVIVPPAIIPENNAEEVFKSIALLLKNGFYGVLANNIAFIDQFEGFKLIGGFRLNIFNSHSLEFYKNCAFSLVEVSPELNFAQLKYIKKSIPIQTMVYGRLPLMVTENCIIKNGSACPCKGHNYITDRIGMRFPVIKDGNECRSIILNCKKTFIGFDINKLKMAGVDFYRVYFTDESPQECVRVSESFFKGTGYRPDDFTGGHFVKGVL